MKSKAGCMADIIYNSSFRGSSFYSLKKSGRATGQKKNFSQFCSFSHQLFKYLLASSLVQQVPSVALSTGKASRYHLSHVIIVYVSSHDMKRDLQLLPCF